jgi:holin-like protein
MTYLVATIDGNLQRKKNIIKVGGGFKMIKYLAQFITIIIIYSLGNGLSAWLKLPVPGSIIGMFLLFMGLLTGVVKLSWIEKIAQLHIKHLTLLFIPFTVGVFHYITIFQIEGLKLVFTLVISSLAVLLVTALIAEAFDSKITRGNDNGNNDS